MNVVCYARCSSERQAEKELSIPGQLTALRKYAIDKGWVIVAEYVDEAESARTTDRPKFKEMLSVARAKNKPFEAVLVWKLSRFARNREDSIIYKSLLRKKGIQIISINEPIEDTPSGKLLEGIIEVIDEFYCDNLSQDVIRGMREAASKGYFCGGRSPYGYKRVAVMDGQVSRTILEPDVNTAPVVRRIFAECLQDKGGLEIAKGLNRDGIPAPGGNRWCKTSVNGIIGNETVTGTLVWGNKRKKKDTSSVRVDNAWIPIVDKETYQKAQSMSTLRSPKITRPRSVSSDYLLGSIMKCAECGSSMVGSTAKSGRFHYYRCANALRRGPEACPGRWLPRNKIEWFIIDRIKGYVLTDENLTELVKLTNEEIETLSSSELERIRMVDRHINDTDVRLGRLYDALETGKLGINELAPRISRLVARKAELNKTRLEAEYAVQEKKLELDDIDVMRRYVEDLKSVLGTASIMEQKRFLKSFVSSVDVSKSEVTVNYTLPMPPLNMYQDTVGVLALGRSGRPYRSRTCDTLIKSKKHDIPPSPSK